MTEPGRPPSPIARHRFLHSGGASWGRRSRACDGWERSGARRRKRAWSAAIGAAGGALHSAARSGMESDGFCVGVGGFLGWCLRRLGVCLLTGFV